MELLLMGCKVIWNWSEVSLTFGPLRVSSAMLAPSLTQPVIFPGWKMNGHACKQYSFQSYNASTFNAILLKTKTKQKTTTNSTSHKRVSDKNTNCHFSLPKESHWQKHQLKNKTKTKHVLHSHGEPPWSQSVCISANASENAVDVVSVLHESSVRT